MRVTRVSGLPLAGARSLASTKAPTHKKKSKGVAAFKAVTQTQIKAAMAQGAALRRLYELQNVSTKAYGDLLGLPPAEMLREMREHMKRHGVAKLSWLHLYLQSVESKEDADAHVPPLLVEYQATGLALSEATAGELVSLTLRTGSDVALMVFHESSRFRIWPNRGSLDRLLAYYAKNGDVEATMALTTRVVPDKGVAVDAVWRERVIRSYANAADPDVAKGVWRYADPLLAAPPAEGLLSRTALHLLLKCCVVTGDASRAPTIEKLIGSSTPTTAKLHEQVVALSAAAAAAAAPTQAAAKQ